MKSMNEILHKLISLQNDLIADPKQGKRPYHAGQMDAIQWVLEMGEEK